MNNVSIAQAAQALNYDQSFTIEADGQMWHGTDDERTYLTTAEIKKITDKVTKTETDKTAARRIILDRLGITADEAALLLS